MHQLYPHRCVRRTPCWHASTLKNGLVLPAADTMIMFRCAGHPEFTPDIVAGIANYQVWCLALVPLLNKHHTVPVASGGPTMGQRIIPSGTLNALKSSSTYIDIYGSILMQWNPSKPCKALPFECLVLSIYFTTGEARHYQLGAAGLRDGVLQQRQHGS